MKFYTHFSLQFDTIYVRGYEDGCPFMDKIDYSPYVFTSSRDQTEFRTIEGKFVEKKYFEAPRAARKYVKEYSNVEGHDLYGTTSFDYQYINDNYKGEVQYDPTLISVVTIDIETDSEGGFPNIRTADKALTAITLRKNDRVITFGTKPYVNNNTNVKYVLCGDEQTLIKQFLLAWRSPFWLPDVITGWNVEGFDIPYLINRITNVFNEKIAKKLSPWDRWERKRDPSTPDDYINFPLGVVVLDYMQLYKKFSFQNQESFKLDHIAFIELGERKLDYTELGFNSLDEFYKGDYQNFINYNIRDVDLVYRLDEKLKLIEQVYAIAYDGKVNLIDSLTTVGMWDIIIHNYLLDKGVVVPLKEKGVKIRQIEGGYVKDPISGVYKWIVSFDLNSLYPHLMMQYNISPETLRGQLKEYDTSINTSTVTQFLDGEIDRVRSSEERARMCVSVGNALNGLCQQGHADSDDISAAMKITEDFLERPTIREILIENNWTVTPTGCLFDREERGFLPTLMETMYDDRTKWKQRMLKAKKEYEVNKTTALMNEVARCHNMQLAKKIQLNSAYGALSNMHFRWFDPRLAESVTKSGQLSIRWMERKINKYLNKLLKTVDVDYVIAIDTDSMYITLDALVNKVYPDVDRASHEQVTDFLDRTSSQIIEPFIDKCFGELATYTNAYQQKMKMKREAIVHKAIWTGKKHYILNMYDLEGVRYKTPKLKMVGIEAVRSSTPAVVREYLREAFAIIMNQTESDLHEFISRKRAEFRKLPYEDVAFPRSVRGLIKKDVYDPRTKVLVQKAYDTGTVNFLKGTPIHVKGALIYNHLLKIKKLTKKCVAIGEGEKIKFCYLRDSSPLPTNVIATPGKLPKELGLDAYLDRDMQFEKSFLDPLQTITDAAGWALGSDQQTLEGFM